MPFLFAWVLEILTVDVHVLIRGLGWDLGGAGYKYVIVGFYVDAWYVHVHVCIYQLVQLTS